MPLPPGRGAAGLGRDPHAPLVSTARSLHGRVYRATDADGDGRVDRGEYLTAIRGFVGDEASPLYEALVAAR
ncbi:hypothetical protein [Streptomyces sp. NPDC053755]|uniref:hypothetical protein n=1 Tax=Streptomyces sp. NPDC053755 TaxID=3155815 RepID=UPI0034128767